MHLHVLVGIAHLLAPSFHDDVEDILDELEVHLVAVGAALAVVSLWSPATPLVLVGPGVDPH
eukprot:2447575-Prorocentrum_lima.AAC.1